MSCSFSDLKSNDLAKTQYATGASARKTFKALLHPTHRASEAVRWAKVDVILQKG